MSFNDLPAHVWPRNARREEDGSVSIAGVNLVDVAKEYGTPVFVVDEDDFRSRCRDMAAAYGGAQRIHYASKAFLSTHIARWVEEEGLALDVASENELAIAVAAGFPMERVTAHGNNKSAKFLHDCVSLQVGHVVVDNFAELHALHAVAEELGQTQNIMIRVTPGVEAGTHRAIATAHEDQKFGFSLSTGDAFEAAKIALNMDHLKLVGLHCHIGSQVFDAEGFGLAAEKILGLYSRIHHELGVSLPELDLGGGFGIAYTEDQEALNVQPMAVEILSAVAREANQLNIDPPTVLVEPGRSIVGPSMVTLYSVGFIKDVNITDTKTRRYIAVDGGMSDNIRPALYQAQYDGRVVSRWVEGQEVASRIVGSHCESGDILIENATYPDGIETGDIFAMPATGAYGYAMSSNYNAFTRPPVVAVKDGQARLLIRGETVVDLLAREV